MRARWQLIGDTFDGVRTSEKIVALTFDDGPTREWTGAILATLARERVRATFFLARHERTNVFWDVEVDAYGRHADSPARYAAAVVAAVRGGSVVPMHPMCDSGQATRDALPGVILGLRDRGFEFLTVSELMQRQLTR